MYVPIESYTMQVKPTEKYTYTNSKDVSNIDVQTPIPFQKYEPHNKLTPHDSLLNRSSLYSSTQAAK
jgi:hypothetical protein